MTNHPTVQEAWAAVMGDVRELGKGDRNQQQGFNFRGVDATMNAVGPALRAHGVTVAPVGVADLTPTTYTTKNGTVMRDVTLVVTYAITGPAGDTMPGAAAGEASDAGDKAVPKAMSVAYRTFLLQALCLPTQERDPDADAYERGAEPAPETDEQKAAKGAEAMKSATTADGVRHLLTVAQTMGVIDVELEFSNGKATLRQYAQARIAELGGTSEAAA